MKSEQEDSIERVNISYENLSNRFMENRKDFGRQYAHLYSTRLTKMKDILNKRVRVKYGNEIPVKRLAELESDTNIKCAIIGTLFKYQELRPSILKELSDELEIVPQPKLLRFVSDNDTVTLEDELQRIKLVGNINPDKIVTGIVAALIGSVDSSGKFDVEDICFHGPGSPSDYTFKNEEKYMIMLSGFDLEHAKESLLALELFVDWIIGFLGEVETSSKIALVLIAGGLFSSKSDTKLKTDSTSFLSTTTIADESLARLAEMVHVEIMPGEYDPTNLTLPQQPIHYKMLPTAASFKSFQGGTNPHCFKIEGRLVIGSSGQPINNISQYSNITDPLDGLESTLKWGHISPTCPDSLGCYPYYDKDPFIIEYQPDIYFTSNHNEFKSKIVSFNHDGVNKQTRLICIPSFVQTKQCVMVNLSDLNTSTFTLNTGLNN